MRSLSSPLAFAVSLLALMEVTGCATRQAQVVAPQPQVVYAAPQAAGPPLMPYEAFLAELNDPPKRQWLWQAFQAGQVQAYGFAASPELWVPITQVLFIPPGPHAGDWNPSGLIEMESNGEIGLLFHEIFHTVYHRSVLHQGSDVHWKEAFCEAFRYAAERELTPPPPSKWVKKFDDIAGLTLEEVKVHKGNSKWRSMYVYPGSLIVKKSGGTLAGLRALWFALIDAKQKSGHDVLNDFFGYSPDATYHEWHDEA